MIRSVNRRATFSALRADGLRVSSGAIRLTFLAPGHPSVSEDPSPAIAFALGQAFGPAVRRNRARRRMRHAFVEAQASTPMGGCFLVVARPEVLRLPYADLVGSFANCLAQIARSSAVGAIK